MAVEEELALSSREWPAVPGYIFSFLNSFPCLPSSCHTLTLSSMKRSVQWADLDYLVMWVWAVRKEGDLASSLSLSRMQAKHPWSACSGASVLAFDNSKSAEAGS